MFSKFLEPRTKEGFPKTLVAVGLVSLFALVAQSHESNPENFSVFLFDYEYELLRRGLLGAATKTLFGDLEPYYIYNGFYWLVLTGAFFAMAALLRRALSLGDGTGGLQTALFCAVLLVSPLFLKNAFYDFGRVDQLGLLATIGFALAPTRFKRVLIVILPPILIFCHEAQIFFSILPMAAIYLIDALVGKDLFRTGPWAPLALGGILAIGLTLYFLFFGIPGVKPEILSGYLEARSPFNTGERSWLLYDDLQANMHVAAQRQGFLARQLVNLPLYGIALILHAPILYPLILLYRTADSQLLKWSCTVVAIVGLAQSAVFALGIDYARWTANIFMTAVVMMTFIVWRFDQALRIVELVRRNLFVYVGLFFIFLPIPRFGVVSP